jgi:hypothetical protein
MKTMKYIVITLLIALSLSGCKRSPEEQIEFEKVRAENVIRVDALNQKSFDNPVPVAKTKNGQVVTMAKTLYICKDCDGRYPDTHYVYMVDGTVSENYTYRSGKTSHLRTEVSLNNGQVASKATDKETSRTSTDTVGATSILDNESESLNTEEVVNDGSIVVNGVTYQLIEVVSRMSMDNFKKYDVAAPIDINGSKYVKLK